MTNGQDSGGTGQSELDYKKLSIESVQKNKALTMEQAGREGNLEPVRQGVAALEARFAALKSAIECETLLELSDGENDAGIKPTGSV